MALYTPFFEQAMATVEQGRNRARISETAQRAYLGDPQAMAELYGIAPDIAQSMERTAIMGGQAAAQAQRNARTDATAAQREQRLQGQASREEQEAANEWYQERAAEIAQIDDYETAMQYAESQLAQAPESYREYFDLSQFTPEQHEQYKQVFREQDETVRQRDQQIAELTTRLQDRVPDPQAIATDIVDGNKRVEVLESGQVRLVDEIAAVAGDVDNAVIELPIGTFADEEARPAPESGQTLWELAPQVAGLASAVRAGGSAISGQLGGPVAEETIEARQTFDVAKNNMIRALSINPRFPVGEINRLEREINIAPRILDSEPGLKARMRAIDRSLGLIQAQQLTASQDPSMPDEERASARANAENIANFRVQMGVPEEISVEDITVEYLEGADRQGAVDIIMKFTDEQLDNLPQDVQEALMKLAGLD